MVDRIRILNTEKTGVDPTLIVEIGAVDLVLKTGEIHAVSDGLVDPGVAITPEASAGHHIVDRDVARRPTLDKVWRSFDPAMSPPHQFVCAAHNAAAEIAVVPDVGVPWLCTSVSALRRWPDAPRHDLQTLRYWLKVDDRKGFRVGRTMPCYRALPKAYVTTWVLLCLLEQGCTVSDMVAWTKEAAR